MTHRLNAAVIPAEAGMTTPYTLPAAWLQGGVMLSFILLELTFREVISNIPHDVGALLIYLFIALFVAFVWHGSRSKPQPGGQDDDSEANDG